MPRRNATGPRGEGPRTGRGLGRCAPAARDVKPAAEPEPHADNSEKKATLDDADSRLLRGGRWGARGWGNRIGRHGGGRGMGRRRRQRWQSGPDPAAGSRG
jgi:hypothetical protein